MAINNNIIAINNKIIAINSKPAAGNPLHLWPTQRASIERC
jgi:hypothetical protein